MEIKSKTYLEVEKDGKLVQLVIDADMPVGLIFDCLMEFKGFCVEKMVKSHQEEQAEANEKIGAPEIAEESESVKE